MNLHRQSFAPVQSTPQIFAIIIVIVVINVASGKAHGAESTCGSPCPESLLFPCLPGQLARPDLARASLIPTLFPLSPASQQN